MSYVFIQKNGILPLEIVKIIFKYKSILSKKPHPISNYIKQINVCWYGVDNYYIKPDFYFVSYSIPKKCSFFFKYNSKNKLYNKLYKIEQYKVENIYKMLHTVVDPINHNYYRNIGYYHTQTKFSFI